MSNSPRYVGFLDPPYTRTFIDLISGAPLDLTGCVSSSFTLTMINLNTGLALSGAGTGVWTVANQTTNKGQAFYQWTSIDMSTAGLWQVYTTVKLPSEPSPREMDPELIEIRAGTVGAGAAPPGVLPNPAATLPFLNPRDFGIYGDNISDNTIQIANLRATARALGGAKVGWPMGTFLSGNLDITNDRFIYHDGCGVGATVIKLKNGANTDLISAQTNLIDLTGASSPGPGVLYNFGFSNMTLDGNKANQTAGPSYTWRVYGYSYKNSNLEIRNGYSGNILGDWNGGNVFATDSMMAQWVNVKTYQSGGEGIAYGGPHDSHFVNIEQFCEASHGLHLYPHAGGCKFVNLHTWASGYPDPISAQGAPPGPLYANDAFTRANQSEWGTAPLGGGWARSGTVSWAISGNKGTMTGGTGGHDLLLLGATQKADVDIHMTINQGTDGDNIFGPAWRVTDVNNYYYASMFEGAMYIGKRVAGVNTDFASPNTPFDASTTGHIRVKMYGSHYFVRMWVDGTLEPVTWDLTGTDSTFSTGQYGVNTHLVGGGIPYTTLFQATSPVPTPVNILVEAPDIYFDQCTSDSSTGDAHVVILADAFHWKGGWIEGAPWSPAGGFRVGMPAHEIPYSGQINIDGSNLSLDVYPQLCDVDTRINHCEGNLGAIWFSADNGHNRFRLMIDQTDGLIVTGTPHATTLLDRFTFNYTGATSFSGDTLQLSGSVQIAKSSTIYSGSGAPSNTLGANGDFYFRTDTPGTANQRLYVKSAGAWTGII